MNSGGVFTFHRVYPPDFALAPSLTLPLATLDGALIGGKVLLDDGTGKWRMATIAGDGSTITTDGVSIPLSARAVALADLSGYVSSSSSTADAFTLSGTSVDGHTWFASQRGASMFTAMPISTVGALTPGSQALVEVNASPSTWRVVTI